MTAWIKVNIAVVPPVPKAKVSTAAAVKTGDNRNCRRAYLRLPGRICIDHLSHITKARRSRFPRSGTGGPRPQSDAIPQSAALLTIQGVDCHGAAIVRKMRLGGGAKQYPRRGRMRTPLPGSLANRAVSKRSEADRPALSGRTARRPTHRR